MKRQTLSKVCTAGLQTTSTAPPLGEGKKLLPKQNSKVS